MKSPTVRGLSLRYGFALTLIALASGLSYLMLCSLIKSHQSSAAIINYSGKRRFLSQQVTLHSLRLAHVHEAQELTKSREALRSSVEYLEKIHNGLLYGDKDFNLPGRPSPEMARFYFEGPQAVDPLLRRFIGLAKSWVDLPNSALRTTSPTLKQIQQLGSNQVIEGLDRAVQLYQSEAERDIALLGRLEGIVLIATLFLLLLEALFIFRPAAKTISYAVNRLEDSHDFLDSTINAIPDAVFVKDTEHRWLLVNDAFCRFLGRPREEIIGKSDYEFFPAEMADLCWQQDNQVFADGTCLENEEILRDASGVDRLVLIKKTRARDSLGRTVLVAAIRDISNLRRMEKDLESSQLESIQSSKMATLGEMTASIAHEIKSPLSLIGLRAGIVRQQAQLGQLSPEIVLESAGKIESLIASVGRIIHSLKTLTRPDFNDQMELASLSVIVSEMIELCRERLRTKSIRLDIAPTVQEISLLCHRSEISQVILNLVKNSIDAVELHPDRWIRIDADKKGAQIEISVTDSGRGVGPELQDKILQPFFTTKARGKGTGLGLTISKRILDRHQGSIYVDTSCTNTRFVIVLPSPPPDVVSINA